MNYLSVRASDITSWINQFGVSTAIVILILVGIILFMPKFWEQYKQQKKREQDQMDRLLNMQSEQTKSVTAALERSNLVIEANTKTVEMNARTNERTQNALIKCTDTLSELSSKIEKNTDLNQKIYNEVILLQNNVQDVKDKVS